MLVFGTEIRSQFLFNYKYKFLNHGSYGAVPRKVNEAKTRASEEHESAPDLWFRSRYLQHYMENIEVAAGFLGAKPENIVFCTNTSSAVNTVLRSLPLKPGDIILVTSWTYGSMKNAAQWVEERTGAVVKQIEMRLPIKSKDEVIELYRSILKEQEIKLAIVDVITSSPPSLVPFREISALCRESGTLVLLDGAHAPGQIDINLEEWDVDFFAGNLHKWVYTNRGCAVLYVKPEHHAYIDPTVTSINLHHSDLRQRFYYQGTDDRTTFCAVKHAIQFYRDIGGLEGITKYTIDLATKASTMLVKRWNTRMLAIPDDMLAPNMRTIRLPDLKTFPITAEAAKRHATSTGEMKELCETMFNRFSMIVFVMQIQGEPYLRISPNVYNCMEDYIELADAILTLQDEANNA